MWEGYLRCECVCVYMFVCVCGGVFVRENGRERERVGKRERDYQ